VHSNILAVIVKIFRVFPYIFEVRRRKSYKSGEGAPWQPIFSVVSIKTRIFIKKVENIFNS
jgi:hypothetical protein